MERPHCRIGQEGKRKEDISRRERRIENETAIIIIRIKSKSLSQSRAEDLEFLKGCQKSRSGRREGRTEEAVGLLQYCNQSSSFRERISKRLRNLQRIQQNRNKIVMLYINIY